MPKHAHVVVFDTETSLPAVEFSIAFDALAIEAELCPRLTEALGTIVTLKVPQSQQRGSSDHE